MHGCPRPSAGALPFNAVLLLTGPRIAAHAVESRPVEWDQMFNAATLATVPVQGSLAQAARQRSPRSAPSMPSNGIDRRYTPYLVQERAPVRTTEPATIQRAYAMLVPLYAAQVAFLTERRDA